MNHHPLLRLASPVLITLAFSTFAGCAASPPPRFVRAADLGKVGPLEPEQPLVIEFAQGDTIPLTFTMDGPLVESPKTAEAIPLTVKRHFFLMISKEGLHASLDGKRFDEKPLAPGRFQVGVGATPKGPMATIAIHGPTPKEPAN